MNNNCYLKYAGLPLAMLTLGISTATAQTQGKFDRKLLLEQQIELPSNTVNAKTIKVTIPAGFKTPDHTHDGPGPRYVVKGKLKVIEGDKTGVYSAGDVFWESGDVMSVENVGKSSAELIIFELAQPKQPEKK
ncbi:cupin domain-containing protein [Methylotuvimicrobium sp. KM2]|uniref:cupin domain-containing protein n=1 Tax=Methylotuvimicrobium sp. KM2 TaxID=3133976 RepID=UPI003100CD8A